MQIKNTVALITGAASGLGAATADHLADLGARCALLDRAIAGEPTQRRLPLPCDVTSETEVEAAFARATDHFGTPPRIVVNCAGIADAARIVGRDGQTSVDLFRRVIEVNLMGTYIVLSHAVRSLRDADPVETGERGVIVNTASIAWTDGQFGQTAYAASKGAIAALNLPAARELARDGIRVMAIAPGMMETPMVAGLEQEIVDQITADIPFPHRLGKPQEFARLVADIAQNPYLNGTTIRLDAATRLPAR